MRKFSPAEILIGFFEMLDYKNNSKFHIIIFSFSITLPFLEPMTIVAALLI